MLEFLGVVMQSEMLCGDLLVTLEKALVDHSSSVGEGISGP